MAVRIKNTDDFVFDNYTWIGEKWRISLTRQQDEKVSQGVVLSKLSNVSSTRSIP